MNFSCHTLRSSCPAPLSSILIMMMFLDVISYYQTLLDNYLILSNIIGCYLIPLDVIGCYLISLDLIGCYMIL